MSETKKPRQMSPKGFLFKANGRVSAEAFLVAHREWLTTGELANATMPILVKLDSKEILPTPALDEIKEIVLAHHIKTELQKAKAAMQKQTEPKALKAWQATVYNQDGSIALGWKVTKDPDTGKESGEWVDLQQDFDMAQDAEGWADRKLFDAAPDSYAEVNGHGTSVRVERKDAIARILRKKKGPVSHTRGASTSSLGFGVKAKQDTAHFSKG